MLSTRTRLSVSQLLGTIDLDSVRLLLEKHGFPTRDKYHAQELLKQGLPGTPDKLQGLLDEIIRTHADLKSKRWGNAQPFDERWEDLVHCLSLQGYRLEDGTLIPVDPTVEGTVQIEDDLVSELKRSHLNGCQAIVLALENSANGFRRVPADYNGCLTNARVALQTLAAGIARARRTGHPGDFHEESWGEVMGYLRASGLLTEREEKGICGVFGFLSEGAHRPLGVSEEEMARLGRSLAASMCYFLIKLHNSGA
jgi:hypothetical protein